MNALRMLFLLVAVVTASATVAGPSKFASSKVMSIRGGAKDLSTTVTTENLYKLYTAWWVYTTIIEKDGKVGVFDDTANFFNKIPNYLKLAGCWFLYQHFENPTQNPTSASNVGKQGSQWLYVAAAAAGAAITKLLT